MNQLMYLLLNACKEIVDPKIQILLSFTDSHITSNLYVLISLFVCFSIQQQFSILNSVCRYISLFSEVLSHNIILRYMLKSYSSFTYE